MRAHSFAAARPRRTSRARVARRAPASHVARPRRALHMRRPMSSNAMQELRELIGDEDKYALPTMCLMAARTQFYPFPRNRSSSAQISPDF